LGEVSIYVAEEFRGRGLGSVLLASLIDASEREGFWTLQASIFPENGASLRLHRKHDFRVVGIREGIGRMAFGELKGRWRDVVLMERRSEVIGIGTGPSPFRDARVRSTSP
jgi:phosphinothricin acetyltransferase